MPAPTAETLAAALRPVTEDPSRSAILCDIDGTLAPIVTRAEDAHVPDKASRLLGRATRRYRLVACISGRAAADARRLVGVGGIVYAGSHGAELLEPGATSARIPPAFESWTGPVASFAEQRDDAELRRLRVRIERKGPIVAFHWRGAPDEDAARTRLEGFAREAEAAGLDFHWGRKVLEIRPPVPFDKGQAVRELVERSGVRAALFGGDDATDLDAFAALDSLVGDGALDAAIKIGVRSAEGPPAIVGQADHVVEGTRRLRRRAGSPAGRMRFPDFLRTCVLLFAGAATALAAVAIAGASAKDDRTLLYFALGWWAIAAVGGLWLGRRPEVTQGIGRALAGARTQPALPELEPGAILFNRLWALAAVHGRLRRGRLSHPAGPRDRGRIRHRCGTRLAQAVGRGRGDRGP